MRSGSIEIALTAMAGLLDEFRAGNIVNPAVEGANLRRHAAALSDRWDRTFPGFPDQYFPFTSFRGEHFRGKRDEYLMDIIVRLLDDQGNKGRTIVNPACVFGRHARELARRLSALNVIATDIDWRWDWWYRHLRPGRTPDNFAFVQDDVFEPRLEALPLAVVFFGACGAVTDGAIDYAIESASPYLMCRTCCHDNIAGNTEVTPRRTYVNWFFRFKNRTYLWMRNKERFNGFYFSDRYGPDRYPRSEAAKGLTNSEELIAVSRDSPNSDVCRTIIDLDRFLHLAEAGYDVWYKGELLIAERTA